MEKPETSVQQLDNWKNNKWDPFNSKALTVI